MLRNLLIQDTLFNKRILLMYAVLLPVFFILYPLLVDHAGMVVGSCFAYLGILPATIMGREHRFRTSAITCSLPVTRTYQLRRRAKIKTKFEEIKRLAEAEAAVPQANPLVSPRRLEKESSDV